MTSNPWLSLLVQLYLGLFVKLIRLKGNLSIISFWTLEQMTFNNTQKTQIWTGFCYGKEDLIKYKDWIFQLWHTLISSSSSLIWSCLTENQKGSRTPARASGLWHVRLRWITVKLKRKDRKGKICLVTHWCMILLGRASPCLPWRQG